MKLLPIKFAPLPGSRDVALWALEIGSTLFPKVSFVYCRHRKVPSVQTFSVHFDAHPAWWILGAIVALVIWAAA